MKKASFVSVAALIATAGTASAQISSIGPFTGPYTESFETQNLSGGPFPVCVVDRVFNNTCDLCAPSGAAHITTGWGFFCTIFPHLGARFTGSTGGAEEYTFDAPVSKFGGYFGTNADVVDGVASFYDASNALIGTAPFTAAMCTWTWNGWQSTVPVKKVSIRGNNPYNNGAFIDMDDMEYQLGGTGPTCYANCDASTTQPCLNVLDFSCFLNEFAASHTYANCDLSTTPPVLNVLDFSCFLNKFAAGCSGC